MISDLAYLAGKKAAFAVFTKEAGPPVLQALPRALAGKPLPPSPTMIHNLPTGAAASSPALTNTVASPNRAAASTGDATQVRPPAINPAMYHAPTRAATTKVQPAAPAVEGTKVTPGGEQTRVQPVAPPMTAPGGAAAGAAAAQARMGVKPAAPAAPATPAAPAPAPAAPAPAPAAPAKPPGVWQGMKEQLPGALLNTGLMYGASKLMSGGDQQQQY